jgi:hypothetical protein
MPRRPLTAEAHQGYDAPAGARSPYLSTSDSDAAWRIGRWMAEAGNPRPREVRAGRGYSYWVDDRLALVTYGPLDWSVDWLLK